MNTAEVLVKCLEAEGVEYIFGIPGEENLDMLKALLGSSIKFITTRHEQGAAFMADVYGRLTHKAGVCMATLGPGATNLVTGVADANSDGAPLVAITGQVGTDRMHLTSHQFLDLVEMFVPITKRSKQIVRPDTVNEIIRIAFKYAESEKPGAVHVDLPCNIAGMEVPDGPATIPLKPWKTRAERANSEEIKDAAALIMEAERPIILAGAGAARNNVSSSLLNFAQSLKIPVVNTMMSKGIIPYDNKYSMWTIGIPQKDYQNIMVDKADLVITVGYDLVEFSPGKWNKGGNHKILHIDTRPPHVNKLYQPVIDVVGDISYTLDNLCLRCSNGEEPEWALQIKEDMIKEFAYYEKDMAFPMKPQKILSDLRKIMGKEDILLSDVGAHKMWIARHYNCYRPDTCLISNGFATMGIAVPGAIAAKLINPDKKVLAVTGDGGFMMNNQEYETAVRIGVPFVTLIFHDDSYGLIKWKEQDRYSEDFFVDFQNPDFVKFAESMKCIGKRIEKAEDLIPVLEESFKEKVPVIIDCPVDYKENVKLTKHLEQICNKYV